MKTRHTLKNKKLIFGVGASLVVVVLLVSFMRPTSALTYQDEEPIYFTFNPTLTLSESTNAYTISNLAAGTTAESNVVEYTISTNSAYGFTVTATVGVKNGNTNLVHSTNSSYKFTSIATNANLSSLTTDNTWGCAYATSTNNGQSYSSWSTYRGFPLDNNTDASERGKGGATLLDTSDYPSSNHKVKVKIAAKAGATQPAGTYTNTINIYAVAKNPAS